MRSHQSWRLLLCSFIALPITSLLAATEGLPTTAQPVEVVTRRTAFSGYRRIVVQRIRPPVFITPPRSAAPAPTEEQQPHLAARAFKTECVLNVGATVYEDGISVLRWTQNGQPFVGFSSINFLHFAGVAELETTTTIYSVFISPGAESGPSPLPSGLALGSDGPEYVVDQSRAPHGEASESDGMDALHAFYVLNREALVAAHQLRVAAAQSATAKPTPLPDIEITLWPERSTTHPR